MIRAALCFLILPFLMACARDDGEPATPEERTAHWSYEGEDGPEHWGELSPEYADCANGREQSPIDLPTNLEPVGGEVRRNYEPTAMTIGRNDYMADIVDNGHTIQITTTDAGTLEFDGEVYDFLQFHFHAPSEHTLAGRHAALEMHQVHRHTDGRFAVVAVFFEEGDAHPVFDAIARHVPKNPGEEVHLEHVTIDVDEILPESDLYYRYRGSLTTPPCSEGVTWLVLAEPVQLSTEQIDAIASRIEGSNRPIQPLREREILLRHAD
jgi:carbonic anhydrase